MLLMSCQHPDIFKFTTMKDDRTKVTGANVSVLFTDEFLLAAEKNEDFVCTFPTHIRVSLEETDISDMEYNKLETWSNCKAMKIHAKELFDLVVEMAWKNGEPGSAFIDKVNNYSPDQPYYIINKCNPCGKVCLK